MMIVKVIARTIGLHRLILLNFYPYIQKYVQVCYYVLNALHTPTTLSKSDVSVATCSLISEMLQPYLQQQFRPAMIWYIMSPIQLIDSVFLFVFNPYIKMFRLGTAWCSWTTVQTDCESVCAWSFTHRGIALSLHLYRLCCRASLIFWLLILIGNFCWTKCCAGDLFANSTGMPSLKNLSQRWSTCYDNGL